MATHEHADDTIYWTPEFGVFSDGCVVVRPGVDLYLAGDKLEVASGGRVVNQIEALPGSIIEVLMPYSAASEAPDDLPRGRLYPTNAAAH